MDGLVFIMTLTQHLRPGKNVLAVKVNNELEPSARFYHGCGIEGHVWLEVTNRFYVAPFETFIKTPTANPKEAQVNIDTKIVGAANQRNIKIVYTVIRPNHRLATISETVINSSLNDTLLLKKIC